MSGLGADAAGDIEFTSQAQSAVASWLPTAGEATGGDDSAIERLPARVGLGAKHIAQAKVRTAARNRMPLQLCDECSRPVFALAPVEVAGMWPH